MENIPSHKALQMSTEEKKSLVGVRYQETGNTPRPECRLKVTQTGKLLTNTKQNKWKIQMSQLSDK